ncbi:methyltransferase domain-containing protein [Microlunatus antarcticus]|uniref:2-polyprenyl-3-methyl-5-hydroxy-6-metoxy-1, 4-benzoquinol methylase n=1 Tax=Microlunatus antarcticus TaxID=53388 RepID=A0A7W5JV39_9ACTN|nr:methyltransferase domain-containing protein [Microlunatus antarcticus]MBB3326851.1 2-polyprenyl-3-methyl-5-hydroxy-6-metoxy-1,4-benzoquinol methylase [Microlunatus antarcticus]
MTDLARRETSAVELMDDPACDLTRLERTYAQFAVVNRLVSGWRRLYIATLRPVLAASPRPTLLDVGFGGGDVARCLDRWARRDGLDLAVTAIDPDPRAAAFVDRRPSGDVTFRRASSADLVAEGRRYDVVVSNHLLHHLDPVALQALLADSERLAGRLALHSDLSRSRLAHRAYGVVTRPLARSSFLHDDGLLSIRRSYRPAELADVRPGWSARALGPFRLLLRHDAQQDGRSAG